jgi:hypothetical protein
MQEVTVAKRPPCDLCQIVGDDVPAQYGARLLMGSWAYVCGPHFRAYGVGLGTGCGQRLVVKDEEEVRS